MNERKQREDRLRNRQSGSWGTTSAMYFDALRYVFCESKRIAAGDPPRPSRVVYAGFPVLIAGVEAFLIEHQRLLNATNSLPKAIAGIESCLEVLKPYSIPFELQQDMVALVEVRNQIVHPSPLPFGRSEWPVSLQRLRDRGLLDGTAPQSGMDVLELLANHRLFEWAVTQCVEVLETVARSDCREELFRGLVRNLRRVLNEPNSTPAFQ